NKTRDGLPETAHFATQTIANGKVYIATQTTLSVYGLLQSLTLVSGANQTAPIFTTLPAPIQVQVVDPYSGVGIPNVSVSFSDGGKGGTFNPPSPTSPILTGTYRPITLFLRSQALTRSRPPRPRVCLSPKRRPRGLRHKCSFVPVTSKRDKPDPSFPPN